MIATTNHIEVPPHFKPHDAYSSHRPLMWLVFENNKDKLSVIEFGSGMGSTQLYGDWCKSNDVNFISFENDKEWCKATGAIFMEDFMDFGILDDAIIFIDSKPGEQRKDLVKRYSHMPLIILHDTEIGARNIYGINEVLQSFKYRLDYNPYEMPSTTVLSNSINVTQWI